MRTYPAKEVFRFLAKIDRRGPNECWNWTGCKSPRLYGVFTVGRRTLRAHRYAYTLCFGPLKEGQVVRHTCHNPSCCNPRHLLSGTHQENTDDMLRAGRQVPPKGEKNGNSKLTVEMVEQIRGLLQDGTLMQKDIAAKFNVCEGTISGIKNRNTWKIEEGS